MSKAAGISKFEENGRIIYSAPVAEIAADYARVRKVISKYWAYVAGGNINHTYCRNIVTWLEANSDWREQADGAYWELHKVSARVGA
jgi:hypothetical protein